MTERTTPTLRALSAATRRYRQTASKHQEARVEAVGAALAALRAGDEPAAVAAESPFTPAYIRRLAREAGIPPAATGRKPRAVTQKE